MSILVFKLFQLLVQASLLTLLWALDAALWYKDGKSINIESRGWPRSIIGVMSVNTQYAYQYQLAQCEHLIQNKTWSTFPGVPPFSVFRTSCLWLLEV